MLNHKPYALVILDWNCAIRKYYFYKKDIIYKNVNLFTNDKFSLFQEKCYFKCYINFLQKI